MTFAEFADREPESVRQALDEMFKGFPQETSVSERRLEPGEVLMMQGNPRGAVYALLSGQVSLMTQHTGNMTYATYALDEMSAYAFLGEFEAMAGYPHIISTIRAKTACRLLRFEEAAYLHWLKSDVNIMFGAARKVVFALLNQSTADRNTLLLKSRERMAMFLLGYYRNNDPQNDVMTVHMARAEIAEAIGFSLRTVNRSVNKLYREGYIGLSKGKITLTREQYKLMNALL